MIKTKEMREKDRKGKYGGRKRSSEIIIKINRMQVRESE
jgi:hypothetical protein